MLDRTKLQNSIFFKRISTIDTKAGSGGGFLLVVEYLNEVILLVYFL